MKPPIAISQRLPPLGPVPNYSYALYPDPPSHDFCPWLVMAEMMRRYHDAPAPLKVRFFLEGGKLGIRDYGPNSLMSRRAYACDVSREYSDIMLANVLRPAIEMMGAVNLSDLHAETCTPIEVANYVEYDYHLSHLVDAARQGHEVPRWQVPQWAFDQVDKFLGGIRPVVITLRETTVQPERNSNLGEWLRFAESIEQKFTVMFVRDTRLAEETLPGHITCPQASTNVYVRAALYQRAFCNLMVGNGPANWCLYSNAPYLICKQLVPALAATWAQGTPQGWREQEHLEVGDQLPWASALQRLTWTDDTFAEIAATFEDFCARAQTHAHALPAHAR